MKKILKKKGFTLIELIVVITILGILVAIAVPSILGYIDEANTAVENANWRTFVSEASLARATDTDSVGTYEDTTAGYSCSWTATTFACEDADGARAIP